MSAGAVSQDAAPLMAAVCQEAACTVSSGATVLIAAIRQLTARAHLAPPATAAGDTAVVVMSRIRTPHNTRYTRCKANQDIISSPLTVFKVVSFGFFLSAPPPLNPMIFKWCVQSLVAGSGSP